MILLRTNNKFESLKIFIRILRELNILDQKKIQANKNIHFVGFIPTNGKVFDKLTSLCSFVLLLSSTEGNATSIATCIRKGLIPIITPESGFEELTSSIIINDINLKSLKKTFTQAASMSRDELLQRSLKFFGFLAYTVGMM